MRIHALTDLGRVRSNNEDCMAFDERLGIAVLADGMGGLSAGEVASDRAVSTVMQKLGGARWTDHDLDVDALLRSSFRDANRLVYELSCARRDYQGMGTTLIAAVARPDGCVTAHVGDSRVYYFGGDRLERVTTDHSLVHELVVQGILSAEEARLSPNRNIITRAIGIEPEVRCDINRVSVRPGDLVLLCSDGLTDMLADDEIAERCARFRGVPGNLLEVLVDEANTRGGFDNVSVVAMQW